VNLGQVQSLVAKRVKTCVRRRRVSHIRRSGEHRAFGAPMNENCTLWTLRVVRLKAFSLLRFFVALDKEMTCRHAQWLTVIKRKSYSRRPLRPKAATRHRPRPPTSEPSNPTPSTGASEKPTAGVRHRRHPGAENESRCIQPRADSNTDWRSQSRPPDQAVLRSSQCL